MHTLKTYRIFVNNLMYKENNRKNASLRVLGSFALEDRIFRGML